MTKKGVGYCRPPIDTRFKPGVSGNPSGRPKKHKTLASEVADLLNEFSKLAEDGHEMTNREAIARELVNRAKDGDLKAATMVLAICDSIQDGSDGADLTPADSEIVQSVQNRASRRGETTGD